MMEHHLRLVYKKTAASVLGALSLTCWCSLSLSLFLLPQLEPSQYIKKSRLSCEGHMEERGPGGASCKRYRLTNQIPCGQIIKANPQSLLPSMGNNLVTKSRKHLTHSWAGSVAWARLSIFLYLTPCKEQGDMK